MVPGRCTGHGGAMTFNTQQRPSPTGHRSFLPWRSRGDKKIAGVAGGLGRAFGIDPILFRVAFVVLAVFGGAGVLLYALGWLLMPADGDEVSAVEALAGRGRSSVSTALTIVLIIVALSSVGSLFSWGIPFWPVVIAAVIVFALARHGRMSSCGRDRSVDWNRRANDFADRIAGQAAAWGEQAGQWGSQRSGRSGDENADGWGGSRTAGPWGRQSSPFERPAFWEGGGASPDGHAATRPGYAGAGTGWSAGDSASGWAAPDPGSRAAGPAAPDAPSGQPARDGAGTPAATPGATSRGSATAEAAQQDSSAGLAPSPEEMLTQQRGTPPAWDPLGVAPFAWDLPDPQPLAEQAPDRPTRGRGVLGRLFLGLALMAGGLAAGGVFAGWWALSWAAVAAITLSVLAFGLLVTSLRGSGGRSLIGPGIFLSLVTLALTVTGISGTSGYGQQTWTPKTVAEVDGQSFHWNAGQATLDLSGLDLNGQTVRTDLIVHAGQATIIVPDDVTVEATCTASLGDASCLGTDRNGVRPEVRHQRPGTDKDAGTLVVEVRSNAGQAEVISNG